MKFVIAILAALFCTAGQAKTLFCDSGWVKNTSGATLDFIGSQADCISQNRGQ